MIPQKITTQTITTAELTAQLTGASADASDTSAGDIAPMCDETPGAHMMPLQVCGQALAAAPAPLPLLPGLLNGTSPGESGPDTVAENRGNPARAGLGLDVARRERRIDIPRLKVPLIVKSRPHAPQPSQGRARGDDERTPPLWWTDGVGQAVPSHLRLRRT